MSTWISGGSGEWDITGNWSDGVPDAAGAIAEFLFSENAAPVAISLTDGSTRTLGVLNVNLTGSGGLVIQGSAGAGTERLVFDGGAAGNATVDYSGTYDFEIAATDDLVVVLQSDTVFTIGNLPSDGALFVNANIDGLGTLIKAGTGRMYLGNSNTYSGGTEISGGLLGFLDGAALGSGNVTISNQATLFAVVSSVLNHNIGTLASASGPEGEATISAANDTTLTLTGTLSHLADSTLFLGTPDGSGTIVAAFSTILENPTSSAISLSFGTLVFGDAYNAANLFDRPGSIESLIDGTIDTAGFATTLRNAMLLDGSIITASSGVVNVTIDYTVPLGYFSQSTIVGTTGNDRLVINVAENFQILEAFFVDWDSSDLIQITGSSADNTIIASIQNDRIAGLDGNDILLGQGGVDWIDGGRGNDIIALEFTNGGSFVDGGRGIDTLFVGGGSQYELGSFARFEAIEVADGAELTLSGAQFADGLSADAMLSGQGTIVVNLSPGYRSMLARAMTVTGTNFAFRVYGTAGTDTIKVAPGSRSDIFGDAGLDVLVGGDLVDYIDGGDGADKITGEGGADILFGGQGADVFKFLGVSDAGTDADADTIGDFLSGTDRLNFRQIDTDPLAGGDQAFAFIGTTAFGAGGAAQIRYVNLGADLRVEADVDGDGVADMHVLLAGAGAQVLTAADFVL
jgi:autotransporter-associated beta strand protein